MQRNQKGFNLTIVLITILAIAVVVAAGLYIKNHTGEAKQPATSNTSQTTEEEKFESATGHSQAEVAVAPAEMVKFSTLPAEAQIVIKAKVTEIAPACIKDGQLVDYNGNPKDPDVAYAEIGSLIIGIGCNSGSATLFAKDRKGDTWSYITRAQFAFDCDTIFENLVPKQLMEIGTPNGECYDKTTDRTQTYDEAMGKRFL